MAKYALGKRSYQCCDICGFRYKYGTLKMTYEKDTATGILACKSCWSPSHPQLRIGEVDSTDPQSLRQPRPDINAPLDVVYINPQDVALATELGVLQQLDV